MTSLEGQTTKSEMRGFYIVLRKKSFRSGLYTPWRGAYWYCITLFSQSVIYETPYCTYMQEVSKEAKGRSFSHLGYYHQSRFLSEADLSLFQRDCSCLEHISVPCG